MKNLKYKDGDFHSFCFSSIAFYKVRARVCRNELTKKMIKIKTKKKLKNIIEFINGKKIKDLNTYYFCVFAEGKFGKQKASSFKDRNPTEL